MRRRSRVGGSWSTPARRKSRRRAVQHPCRIRVQTGPVDAVQQVEQTAVHLELHLQRCGRPLTRLRRITKGTVRVNQPEQVGRRGGVQQRQRDLVPRLQHCQRICRRFRHQRGGDQARPFQLISSRSGAGSGGRSAGTPRAGEADSPESRCCLADRHNRQDLPDQRDQAAVNRTIHPVIEERRAAMASSGGLTVALRHRDFRYLIGAYSVAAIGGWAYNVGLAVWIYDETGSAAWVGAATVCRFVPALLFGPYGGVLADRSERVRLMVRLDVVAAVLMGLLVVVTALDFPVPLAILITAVASTVGTMYAPAAAALTPQLVGERDLGAANTLRNTIDNLCVIAGPAVGALLLLLGPASLAIGLNSLMYIASACMVAAIRSRSTPADVTEGGSLGVVKADAGRCQGHRLGAHDGILVAYSAAATLVYGFDTVQFVVLSRDVLGTGAEGYGYLLAGLGVGGLLAAPFVVRLVTAAVAWLDDLAGYGGLLPPHAAVSRGVRARSRVRDRGDPRSGHPVVDVLAVTALQRSLPNQVLARVFAVFDSLLLVAIVVAQSPRPS